MKYSPWMAFLYTSSAFRDMSEGLVGLERALRRIHVESPSGDVRPYKNFDPCVPGHSCTVTLPRLRRALRELAGTAQSSFALALRAIAVAEANGIREFDVRLSAPVGPAPDREGHIAKRPARRRPPSRRPRPKRSRSRPKRRAR
jgi:hypothetical protein